MAVVRTCQMIIQAAIRVAIELSYGGRLWETSIYLKTIINEI
jgi:hypothetical protein